MKIFVGSDHAGFTLKESLVLYLKSLGYEVTDYGAFEYNEGDDYPDFVVPVAREVSKSPDDTRGIVFGGSGQGEAMTANRFKHVRASVYYGHGHSVIGDERGIIKVTRDHNDSNVLSFGARFITDADMRKVTKEWLEAPFSNEERHKRRIEKMDNIHD